MFVEGLRNSLSLTAGKGSNGKSDPSTMGIIFMAFLCAVLPLDISQLSFAILGAVLYALLQKSDQFTAKKKPVPVAVDAPRYTAAARAPKPKAWVSRPASVTSTQAKPVPPPVVSPEVRAPSVQPIVAPTFRSDGWEGEIQELLLQITPTPEVENIVSQLAQMIKQTIQSVIPEVEVNGFANGNFTFGKAFGVAVPEVDIVASVSPRDLFKALHGRSSQCSTTQLDEKKLQKSAIRTCTDRLVSAGGFKFRRSAFRGQEPKVTLLAPASLGLFSDSIAIDFSVNVETPFYNAALLTECGRMDSRAKELILLVKRWAKDRGICHVAKGHLSPYMWGLLSMYFLQVGVSDEGPLLPPLAEFQMSSSMLKGKKSGKSTSKQQTWKAPAEAKKSPGTLFMEFVSFFETQFDWRNEAVSICAACRGPPSKDTPLHIIASEDSTTSEVGPSIEDPFHDGKNLGDGMTAASLARLKEELSRAGALCRRGASLSELLEPWAPAEAAEPRDDEEQGEMVVTSKASKAEGKSAATPPSTPPWREVKPPANPSSTPPWRRAAAAAK